MSHLGVPFVYVTPEIDVRLQQCNPDDKFLHWINDMKKTLLQNRLAGQPIPKRQIPNYYKQRHEVTNLYWYHLPEGNRACYCLQNFEGIGVCAIILEVMNHTEYNRRFGYHAS